MGYKERVRTALSPRAWWEARPPWGIWFFALPFAVLGGAGFATAIAMAVTIPAMWGQMGANIIAIFFLPLIVFAMIFALVTMGMVSSFFFILGHALILGARWSLPTTIAAVVLGLLMTLQWTIQSQGLIMFVVMDVLLFGAAIYLCTPRVRAHYGFSALFRDGP